jgi:large subunit ribosomal protein L5
MEENPIRSIRIEKITLNIGCGDDKNKLEKAAKLLEYLTERKPLVTKSKRRSTFGVPKGKPIGVMITLRGKGAEDFFRRAIEGVEKKLKASQFDDQGNFSFGLKEYIDVPGVRYKHDIGMFGLDVVVTLKRAGFRIKWRRIQKRKIPAKHKINKEETMEWLKKNFGVELIEQKH